MPVLEEEDQVNIIYLALNLLFFLSLCPWFLGIPALTQRSIAFYQSIKGRKNDKITAVRWDAKLN